MAEITYSKPTWANTTTPAISAANLQAISDALDKAVHVANRGGALLDADTVSGYGIGNVEAVLVSDLGSGSTVLLKNGIYAFETSCANAPQSSMTGICYSGYTSRLSGRNSQLVIGTGATYSGYVYYRSYVGGTWDSWVILWSGRSDGNGGQPPAPKPTTGTPTGGANGVGQRLSGNVAASSTLYASGSSNLTGTWDCVYIDYIVASGLSLSFNNLITNGGLYTVASGHIAYYITTRIA